VVVVKEKKKIWLAAGIAFFAVYFFVAARPIKRETVLVSRWLSSLESGGESRALSQADAEVLPGTQTAPEQTELFPFVLGDRFGYVDSYGRFPINRIKKGGIALSENCWAEYGAEPETIEIKNNSSETELTIEDPRGYPLLLDGRTFIIGSEQNALSEVDGSGNVIWTYEFAAPLTCIAAAAGLVLTGSLDGAAEILDGKGNRIFFFEPGGSRYAVILGCAMSRDGSRIGIISGVDDQRFLLLERFGGETGEYKVICHEFLEDGFRRPVHIEFIEQDRWIVFERQGGIGIYELSSRQGTKVALDGEITAIDRAGGQGIFFFIISLSAAHKKLVGLRLPGSVIIEAPFKSADVFIGRTGSRLLVGGGAKLAAFELEKK
jgi:hypothetical protein